MKFITLVLAFSALAACSVRAATAAPACDVKATVPDSARAFAQSSGNSPWIEYQSISYTPDPTGEGAQYAQYWLDTKGMPSVFIIQPGKLYWIYTRYCFSVAGQLEDVSFILNSTSTWGYRLDGTVTEGVLKAQTSYFFNNYSGVTIARPGDADTLADAMKPTLYLDSSKLPFASLLAQPAKPAVP